MHSNMKLVLIGRGKNGWHADTIATEEYTGYVSTGSSSGGSLETYLKEAEDGTPIYSAEEADMDAFVSFVFRGPMVKASLPPGGISRFHMVC